MPGEGTAIRARAWTCLGFRPARAIVAEKLVEFSVRHHAGKTVELALVGDLARRLDERMHGDARQRAAHADAPHAHLAKLFDREAERATVEKIDRLRRDRLHGRRDLLAGLDAGRVEAIGAGVGKGLQPADGLGEVSYTHLTLPTK